MEAASIVLAGASNAMGGTVVVQSAEEAYLIPKLKDPYKTKFRKVAQCVYIETDEAPPGYESRYFMIDFSKLNGHYSEYGEMIDFQSPETSHCFHLSNKEQGCWNGGLHIQNNIEHQQMIDDVGYLLRHGCGASVNDDPNPH
jgi:hypothetical protein